MQDPEAFNPDRFINSEGKFQQSEYNVTFGLGKRNCMGKTVALAKLFLFMSGLVQNLRFSLPEDRPMPDMSPQQGFVLGCPAYPICIQERQ